jgi:hypothetical protein
MECERFKRLLKTWYIQVQNESLAPARMVDFMENHVSDCSVCLMDPTAKKDIAKIITLILPQDKLRQATKSPDTADQDDFSDDTDDTTESADEDVVDDDDDIESDETDDDEDKETEDDLDEDTKEDD